MFIIQKRTIDILGLLTILLIVINLYTTIVSKINFEYSSILVAFFLSLLIILFSREYGILAMLVFFKSLVLSYFYDPIDEGDALTYYEKAIEFTKDGNFVGIVYETIQGGIYSIVESVSIIYAIIMVWLKTNEPFILVYSNHLLFFISTIIFVNLLMKKNIISYKYKFIFLIGMNLSPLINKYISFVLKESIVMFLIISFIWLLMNNKSKLLTFIILIFGSLMRPYFIFYSLGLLFLLEPSFIKKRFIYLILVSEFILFYTYNKVFLDVSLIVYFKDIFLSFAGIILSPNFLRIENWINFPLMTLESLFIAITWLFFIINKQLMTNYKKTILISMLFFSIALGAIASNRDAANDGKGNFLVAENISRKKISIDFINYYLVVLVFFKRRYFIEK